MHSGLAVRIERCLGKGDAGSVPEGPDSALPQVQDAQRRIAELFARAKRSGCGKYGEPQQWDQSKASSSGKVALGGIASGTARQGGIGSGTDRQGVIVTKQSFSDRFCVFCRSHSSLPAWYPRTHTTLITPCIEGAHLMPLRDTWQRPSDAGPPS